MWQKKLQKYNKLVWKCQQDNKLKSEILDKMNISVRMICNLKREKSVYLNGENVPLHTQVKKDDLIEINLPEESNDYLSQNLEIKVIYEDCDLLVVETTISNFSQVKIVFIYRILDSLGKIYSQGETTLVCVHRNTGKPGRLPSDIYTVINNHFTNEKV